MRTEVGTGGAARGANEPDVAWRYAGGSDPLDADPLGVGRRSAPSGHRASPEDSRRNERDLGEATGGTRADASPPFPRADRGGLGVAEESPTEPLSIGEGDTSSVGHRIVRGDRSPASFAGRVGAHPRSPPNSRDTRKGQSGRRCRADFGPLSVRSSSLVAQLQFLLWSAVLYVSLYIFPVHCEAPRLVSRTMVLVRRCRGMRHRGPPSRVPALAGGGLIHLCCTNSDG